MYVYDIGRVSTYCLLENYVVQHVGALFGPGLSLPLLARAICRE